jgi:hypothetical protein
MLFVKTVEQSSFPVHLFAMSVEQKSLLRTTFAKIADINLSAPVSFAQNAEQTEMNKVLT